MAHAAKMMISEDFGQAAPDDDRRIGSRRPLRLIAQGTQKAGQPVDVLIHNISETGLLIESDTPLVADDRIEIDLPHSGPTAASIVWASGRLFGCQFDAPIGPASLSAAQLKSGVRRDLDLESEPATPLGERFGARLQRFRLAKGFSQTEVADRMGVSAPSISGWEKGRARPKGNRVAALADLLGVSISDLLGEVDAPSLRDLIDQSREQIAQAVGTSTDKVRITVEL